MLSAINVAAMNRNNNNNNNNNNPRECGTAGESSTTSTVAAFSAMEAAASTTTATTEAHNNTNPVSCTPSSAFPNLVMQQLKQQKQQEHNQQDGEEEKATNNNNRSSSFSLSKLSSALLNKTSSFLLKRGNSSNSNTKSNTTEQVDEKEEREETAATTPSNNTTNNNDKNNNTTTNPSSIPNQQEPSVLLLLGDENVVLRLQQRVRDASARTQSILSSTVVVEMMKASTEEDEISHQEEQDQQEEQQKPISENISSTQPSDHGAVTTTTVISTVQALEGALEATLALGEELLSKTAITSTTESSDDTSSPLVVAFKAPFPAVDGPTPFLLSTQMNGSPVPEMEEEEKEEENKCPPAPPSTPTCASSLTAPTVFDADTISAETVAINTTSTKNDIILPPSLSSLFEPIVDDLKSLYVALTNVVRDRLFVALCDDHEDADDDDAVFSSSTSLSLVLLLLDGYVSINNRLITFFGKVRSSTSPAIFPDPGAVVPLLAPLPDDFLDALKAHHAQTEQQCSIAAAASTINNNNNKLPTQADDAASLSTAATTATTTLASPTTTVRSQSLADFLRQPAPSSQTPTANDIASVTVTPQMAPTKSNSFAVSRSTHQLPACLHDMTESGVEDVSFAEDSDDESPLPPPRARRPRARRVNCPYDDEDEEDEDDSGSFSGSMLLPMMQQHSQIATAVATPQQQQRPPRHIDTESFCHLDAQTQSEDEDGIVVMSRNSSFSKTTMTPRRNNSRGGASTPLSPTHSNASTQSGRSTPYASSNATTNKATDDIVPQEYTNAAELADRFTIDYKCLLGKGAFGNVYKAFDTDRGFHVAVKEFKLPEKYDDDGEDSNSKTHDAAVAGLKSEFELLAKINHENIVNVFALMVQNDEAEEEETEAPEEEAPAALSPDEMDDSLIMLNGPSISKPTAPLDQQKSQGTNDSSKSKKPTQQHKHLQQHKAQIFMEWVPGGSIQHLLQTVAKPNGFREPVVRRYTRSLLEGLNAIHSAGVLHRDLKPGNMLLTTDGDIKLADFGTAQIVRQLDFHNSSVNTAKLHKSIENSDNSVVGTLPYLAPECISRGSYSRASDVWAVGCTVLELLTGSAPWSDADCYNSGPLALLFLIGGAQPPNHHPTLPLCRDDCCENDVTSSSAGSCSSANSSFSSSPMRQRTSSAASLGQAASSAASMVSHQAIDFLKKCFAFQPSDRATVEQLLNHPFVQQ